MDEDSEDIYQTSLVDRYAARPDQLNGMCLAEFAANYTTRSGQELAEEVTTDALPTAKDGNSDCCRKELCHLSCTQRHCEAIAPLDDL